MICLLTIVFAFPQIGELLLTYSVTQSVFSHDMSSHVYYARLSIQICLLTNKRMIITNFFSNSSMFTMILLTIVFASCTNRRTIASVFNNSKRLFHNDRATFTPASLILPIRIFSDVFNTNSMHIQCVEPSIICSCLRNLEILLFLHRQKFDITNCVA